MAINKTFDDGSINSGHEETWSSFSESEYSSCSENEIEVIRPKPKSIAKCNIICISSSEDEDTSDDVTLINKQAFEKFKNINNAINNSSNGTSNKIPQRLKAKKPKGQAQSKNDKQSSVPGKSKGQKKKLKAIQQNKKLNKNLNKHTQNQTESKKLRNKNTSAKDAPGLHFKKVIEDKTDAICLQKSSLYQSTSTIITNVDPASTITTNAAVIFNASSLHKHCNVLVTDHTVKNDVIWKDIGGMLSFIDSSRFYSSLIYSKL